MIHKESIVNLIESYLADNSLFLVDIKISSENDIEITIESTEVVDIRNCADISKIVESGLDREIEDYSLTVSSAGLDQPFKVFRQYQKFIGKEVEVVFKNGTKQTAILSAALEDKIELSFSKLEKIEGKKKRERVDIIQFYNLDEIKSTKPFINFR
ncbi:MAG: ribosome assembly cofactor RimP [Bacteroidales bacterium]|jgi:ribosome maturation factor RimP